MLPVLCSTALYRLGEAVIPRLLTVSSVPLEANKCSDLIKSTPAIDYSLHEDYAIKDVSLLLKILLPAELLIP